MQQFLQPTGEIAEELACCNPLQSRQYHPPWRVVTHRDGRRVALAPERRPIQVEPDQLMLYQLNRQLMIDELSRLLGIRKFSHSPSLDQPTLRIGTLVPLAGLEFPAFLSFPRSISEFSREVDRIIVETQQPFLLLVPTDQSVTADLATRFERHRGWLISLRDTIGCDAQGRLGLAPAARQLVESFLAKYGPSPARAAAVPRFLTPADASWSELRMRFVDGETISLVLRETSATVNYTQLGMASLRNGRPTKQWELLREFAHGYGHLDWSHRAADRRNQKRKELLAKQLKQFFQIAGPPFEAAGNGWKTVFTLLPDA